MPTTHTITKVGVRNSPATPSKKPPGGGPGWPTDSKSCAPRGGSPSRHASAVSARLGRPISRNAARQPYRVPTSPPAITPIAPPSGIAALKRPFTNPRRSRGKRSDTIAVAVGP